MRLNRTIAMALAAVAVSGLVVLVVSCARAGVAVSSRSAAAGTSDRSRGMERESVIKRESRGKLGGDR